MKTNTLLALSISLLLAACDSGDDGGAGGGGGTGDAGGEPADAGEEEADAAKNTTQEYFCDPAGDAVCQNETDCPLIEDGSAKVEAIDCGKACLGTKPEENCTEDCIVERVATTRDCANCLDEFFACIFERCVRECIAGTDAECTECSRNKPDPETSCSGGFFVCSGAVLNPDYVVPGT